MGPGPPLGPPGAAAAAAGVVPGPTPVKPVTPEGPPTAAASGGTPGSGLATNSIFFYFLFGKKSLICLMIPHRGNTIFFRSSQQLPRLRLRPLNGFLS